MSDEPLDPSTDIAYWFARDLVAARFARYATNETESLKTLSTLLKERLSAGDDTGALKKHIQDNILDSVGKFYRDDISKKYRQTEDMTERILRRIDSREDVEAFVVAADAVIRTSEILSTTPRFGANEIHAIVDEILETNKDGLDHSRAFDALFLVDVEGETYQLGAQRFPLIAYVDELMSELRADSATSSEEVARIVSAVVQEYERRAGNSRASTAGNVLETGLQRIFDRFEIPTAGVPQHYGDLEVDNIVDGPDATIGFSCKRTLRERFKQSLARQSEIGADEIWFVSLRMADVSQEKIRAIANDGGRIYVPRDSLVWEQYGDEDELAYALRPADTFLTDVTDFSGCSMGQKGQN